MFGRKKTLVEHEPTKLSLELLSILQEGLMAKLLEVNRELAKRYGVMANCDVPGTEGPRAVMVAGLERLSQLSAVLEAAIARNVAFRADKSANLPTSVPDR